MTTILITGANGFIGAQYASRAKARGWRAIGVDLQPAANHASLDLYRPLDVSDPDAQSILNELPAPDVVLHAGGISGFMVATDRPRHIVDVNVAGTMPILELARAKSVRRTVLCSTIMVYGPDRPLGETRNENEYPRPVTVYGASKVAIEALMHGHRGQYGTDSVALRFSHVYGPGRTTQCFVRDMLTSVRDGTRCDIPHAGRAPRQYVHVDDVCASIDRAFDIAEPAERVFNISADEIHTLAEVADAVKRIAGSLDVHFDEDNDPTNYRIAKLSIERARRVLGYSPSLPLSAGIAHYWKEAFAPRTIV